MVKTTNNAKASLKKDIFAADLFCGAGGLTRGFLDAGIHVVAGYDIDETCRFPYEKNNPPAVFKNISVADLTGEDLASLYPEDSWRVLVGCAPCQPFSKYTQGIDSTSDAKWGLLSHFARLVDELKPDVVSMENVPELRRHSIYDDFVSTLRALKYHVWCEDVFSPDYGVPQNRTRLVLLASRLGPIGFIPPTHRPKKYRTVKQAIGGLPRLAAGEVCKKDLMHRTSRLRATNLDRIRQSKPGGSWRDWSEDLVAKCHLLESGKSYRSVYGRMEWDKPSPTITTQFYGFGNGRFGHPEQDRAISLREGAILQSFPKDYRFSETGKQISFKEVGKMIGNAVPVRLGRIIGRTIKNHVVEHGK